VFAPGSQVQTGADRVRPGWVERNIAHTVSLHGVNAGRVSHASEVNSATIFGMEVSIVSQCSFIHRYRNNTPMG
jgi:hypothetical protein